MAFVKMGPPLQANHRDAAEMAEMQGAAMARDRRLRKARQFGIGYDNRIGDGVGQRTET